MFHRKANTNTFAFHGGCINKQDSSQKPFKYDLMDISGVENMSNNDTNCVDDDELEKELLILTSGDVLKPVNQARSVVNQQHLSRMIQESLRDIPSDEDVSSGEDDSNLLSELKKLQFGDRDQTEETHTFVENVPDSKEVLLMDRLKMYEIAERNAKNVGDFSKVRRMGRGITTLKNLIKKIHSGQEINQEEIPPAVSVAPSKTVESMTLNQVSLDDNIPASSMKVASPCSPLGIIEEASPIPLRINKRSSPSSDISDESELKINACRDTNPVEMTQSNPEISIPNVDILKKRQDEYKKAAVVAKRSGDIPTALSYVKIVKHFDTMINAAVKGAVINLSSIPPPPPVVMTADDSTVIKVSEYSATLLKADDIKLTSNKSEKSESAAVYGAPKTVIEALEQRMKKYQECEEAAKRENNSSKTRRMGRIIQQYKDAIKLCESGKAVPVDELPTPPGFAPIPVDHIPNKSIQSSSRTIPATSPSITKKSSKTALELPYRTDHSNYTITNNEEHLSAILERQKLFKIAALKAKQNGNLTAAKEYLRTAKGFDSMVDACKCGLPINMSSLPLPPNGEMSLEFTSNVVKLNDRIEGSDLDVYNKLQTDLQQQLEMCIRTRDHYKAMGDIPNANNLEQLAMQTKKDLNFIQVAEKSNLKVPKFHYETKPFTVVQCNTDLSDNDLELSIVQGINYNVPNSKEINTYVKVTFPYPAEDPPQYKTSVIYNTNNPVYNATTTFHIQRNARACRRIFLRQAVKCEVWSKGGFFRSDSLIGTVNAKLTPLETQCTVHNAYELMDGRRKVGGRLELKMRIRDPIIKKQVEQVVEKWLIIDT